MNDVRNKITSIRLNDEESQKLAENAKKLGVSQGAYLRMIATLDFEVVEDIVGRDILFLNPYFFRLLDYDLNRYGNNLNQAIKALHIIKRYCIEKRLGTRSLYQGIEKVGIKIEEIFDTLCKLDAKVAEISRSSYCVGTYETR